MGSRVKMSREGRSKLNFFLDGKTSWTAEVPAIYMTKLTRKQASTIFKARIRMTKVKGNYKNLFPNLRCRACKEEQETQKHVLQDCKTLQNNNLEPNEITTDNNTEN